MPGSAWTTWSPPVEVHARPEDQHPARPYLLPNQKEFVYVSTKEDKDLSGAPNSLRRTTRGRGRGLELALEALRSSDALSGLAVAAVEPTANRPIDALRRRLEQLDLPATVAKSLSRSTGVLGDTEGAELGPSLSVALPQSQAAAEDSSPAWIDNLVKDALATARRTGRDLDVPALARAANLPRAVIEERIATLGGVARIESTAFR